LVATSRNLLKNTFSLTLAQVMRVGLNSFLSLSIAHWLGAEGLGKYAILTAYFLIFRTLIAMGVPRFAIREIAQRPDVEEKRRWFQAMVVNQSVGAAAGVGLLIAASHLLSHPPDTTRALGIAALALLPQGLSWAIESVFQAEERMELIAVAQVAGRIAQVLGSVIALWLGQGIITLGWMLVLGQTLSTVIELFIITRDGFWQAFQADVKRAIRLSRLSFDFFVQSILATTFTKTGTLLLAWLAGEEAVGMYSAAHLIIQVVNFLSLGYSQAIYPVLSRLFVTSRTSMIAVMQRSTTLVLAVTVWAALQITIVAQPLIDLLYGKEYALAVQVLRIEAPFVVLFLWNALFSSSLLASGRQRKSITVSGVKLATSLGYYPPLVVRLGASGAALGTVLAGLVGAGLNSFFLNQVHPVRWGKLLKPVGVGAVVWGGVQVFNGLPWTGAVLGSTVSYWLLIFAIRVISRNDLDTIWQIVLSMRSAQQ